MSTKYIILATLLVVLPIFIPLSDAQLDFGTFPGEFTCIYNSDIEVRNFTLHIELHNYETRDINMKMTVENPPNLRVEEMGIKSALPNIDWISFRNGSVLHTQIVKMNRKTDAEKPFKVTTIPIYVNIPKNEILNNKGIKWQIDILTEPLGYTNSTSNDERTIKTAWRTYIYFIYPADKSTSLLPIGIFIFSMVVVAVTYATYTYRYKNRK